jgi:hypothetical protein
MDERKGKNQKISADVEVQVGTGGQEKRLQG